VLAFALSDIWEGDKPIATIEHRVTPKFETFAFERQSYAIEINVRLYGVVSTGRRNTLS
jgi:hypothetical protein